MAGQCIERLSHDECGSSDGVQVFKDDRDTFTGYCFACDTFIPDPYRDKGPGYTPSIKVKTQQEIDEEFEEIRNLEAIDLPERKLKKYALDYFGIKVGVSEQDGVTPTFHYYPYTSKGEVVAYKARLISGKKMWSVGNIRDADLFGWEQAIQTGAKRLFITEGELDAVALYQALKDKSKGTQYEDYDPAVVSLVSGASSTKKDLAANQNKIKSYFKEIVFVFDQDDPGKQATVEGMKVFPYATAVTLPCKDANECLIKGHEKALCNAVLFKAEKPKNTNIIQGKELIEAARQKPEWGLSWPWDGLTGLTRGIRWGETIYLGAGVKMGKTTVVSVLAAHFIIQHKLKVFLAQPEEANVKTFKSVAGKVAGRVFDDPDQEFDEAAYDRVAPIVGESLYLLSLYQDVDWENLRADIISAVDEGCRVIFIDPITNITNGKSASDANTILQDVAQNLAVLAKDLNIIIFIFCHLKAPEGGPPHERGGKVYSSQFAGSRAMMRSCHLMLGLEGNKDPDLSNEQRNVRRIVILEDRAYGASGYVNLYYDHNTGLLNEIKEV